MNKYKALNDYIFLSESPARECDIKSVYKYYTGGNGWKDKALYNICVECGSLETFTALYREIENEIINQIKEAE